MEPFDPVPGSQSESVQLTDVELAEIGFNEEEIAEMRSLNWSDGIRMLTGKVLESLEDLN